MTLFMNGMGAIWRDIYDTQKSIHAHAAIQIYDFART